MSLDSTATASQAVWTLEKLVTTPQGQFDELFRASAPHAGTMPDGDTRGIPILGKRPTTRRFWAAFARALCWQGKVFQRENDNSATLVNKILFFSLKAIRANVYRGPSRLDDQDCIILDYSKTSFVAKPIRDEIREISPGIYLGLVYWGKSKKVLLRFALGVNK